MESQLLMVYVCKLRKDTQCYVNPEECSYSSQIPEAEGIYARSQRVLNVGGKFLPFHNQTELSQCADRTHCPILLNFDGRAKTHMLLWFH